MATSFKDGSEPRSQAAFRPMFGEAALAEPAAGEALPHWLNATRQAQNGFAAGLPFGAATADEFPLEQSPTQDDALTLARREGEQAGYAAAKAEFDAKLAQMDASFATLETDFASQLSTMLSETVMALCETTLAPLVLDKKALVQRCKTATDMLHDQLSDAKLALHPEDMETVQAAIGEALSLKPDPTLALGSFRLETPNAVILDGPDQWRDTIRSAIDKC